MLPKRLCFFDAAVMIFENDSDSESASEMLGGEHVSIPEGDNCHKREEKIRVVPTVQGYAFTVYVVTLHQNCYDTELWKCKKSLDPSSCERIVTIFNHR